jgi:hypothetical protein
MLRVEMAAARFSALIFLASLSIGCVEQGFTPPYGAPPPYGAMPPYAGYGAPGYGGPGYGAPAQVPWAPGSWTPAGAPAAVAFAQSRLGAPYCWGGNGPSCYDCSGLTRAAWMAGGRLIPRTSEEQLAALAPVEPVAVQPGDILWRPGHVGLYVGGGWAIAATHRGDFVRYQRADHFVRAVRP